MEIDDNKNSNYYIKEVEDDAHVKHNVFYVNKNIPLDEEIIKEMEKYDFDVLLTGASTSSVFYAKHAKEIGKIGIQTGGVIQLFFGILGYRWTKVPGYSKWNDMYNEHWIYPLEIDEAHNRKNNMHLETNFAYW